MELSHAVNGEVALSFLDSGAGRPLFDLNRRASSPKRLIFWRGELIPENNSRTFFKGELPLEINSCNRG
jgi:hypothetical protein